MEDRTPYFVRIYADYWTARELEALLAFYRSALGTRFRTFLPVFTAEMAKVTAMIYDDHAVKIERLMRREGLPP